MNYALLGAGVLVAAAALGFVFLFRRLISAERDPGASLEWCSRFSIEKYRPMERLFFDEDYHFLAAQPGASPKIGKRLRVARRRVFRHYLRCLSRDFDRLYTAAKFLLLHSPQDRPDLASALLKQRLIFRYAMAAVECRLVLQTAGVGKVDVRGLVSALEAMRDQLRQLTPRVEQSVVA
jgi:hypothetical protein